MERKDILNLKGKLEDEWNRYLRIINHSAIILQDREYELVWTWNYSNGKLIAKLGYKALISTNQNREQVWW